MPSTHRVEADGDTTDTDELFSIGELAEELATTTRTIRYYEECGLISPQRTDGNQRRYTRKERGRLKLVLRAKGVFSLDEIRELFTIYDAQPNEVGEQLQFVRLCEMMTGKVAQVDEQLRELTHLRGELQDALEEIKAQIWAAENGDPDSADCGG
jgi:DNA-binding transcriptional MerR regulator